MLLISPPSPGYKLPQLLAHLNFLTILYKPGPHNQRFTLFTTLVRTFYNLGFLPAERFGCLSDGAETNKQTNKQIEQSVATLRL